MTRDTLIFLRSLLASQVLSVGAEDFAATAAAVSSALAELDAAIAAAAVAAAAADGSVLDDEDHA